MTTELIPVSFVIPTMNRATVLRAALESLATQSLHPAEVIVVDASEDARTRSMCIDHLISGLCSDLIWLPARSVGAASQRNQGVREARQVVIGFCDDDVLFRQDCIARLWRALQSDANLGGVGAMIENQRYHPLGIVSRAMLRLMGGQREPSYAGRVLGPAVTLLPDDRDDLPYIVPVEWLNTGCVIYRREALPDPPFPAHFTGYSMMEDIALSLSVGKRWKLANARTARIFHDSQPGSHKSNMAELSEMELVNRHYVMKHVLAQSRSIDYLRLIIWELFQIVVAVTTRRDWRLVHQMLVGKVRGLRRLLAGSEPTA